MKKKSYIIEDKHGNVVAENATTSKVAEITGYTLQTVRNKTYGVVVGEPIEFKDYIVRCMPQKDTSRQSKNISSDFCNEWDRVCMLINSRLVKA